MWDEGRRLLVSPDTEGKPMTIESRPAEMRRSLIAVQPMTQQGQWVCFGPDLKARPTDGTSQLNLKHQPTPTASCKKSLPS